MDIGVLSGKMTHPKVLFLEKRRINQPETEFEITVSELPTLAGIDPFNKLIDRQPDDNVIPVNKSQ